MELLLLIVSLILIWVITPIVVVGAICYRAYHAYRHPTDYGGGHEAPLPDFVDTPYDETVDEQASGVVATHAQEYLNRDYRDAVMSRFPIFSPDMPIPQALSAPPLKLRDARAVNDYLYKTIPSLEGKNWSNQTLSYMRINTIGKHIRDCIIHPLIEQQVLRIQCPVVDITGNIGGDSIGLALDPLIGPVTTYELLPQVYEMLVANVKLYGLEDKITTRNERFAPTTDATYDVPLGSLVIIDPPYELGNNSTNFNLSVDRVPIYVVCARLLQSGASVVMITMPLQYQYNQQFARDLRQHVTAYRMGSRNNKVYVVRANTEFDDPSKNFESYTVTVDPTKLNKKGKPNPWLCITTPTTLPQ